MKARHGNLTPVVFWILGASQFVHGLQCKFRLASYTYDLCPLLFTSSSLRTPAISSVISRQIHLQQDKETPPTVTRQEYDIDLGGEGLAKDGTLPATEQVRDFIQDWFSICTCNVEPRRRPFFPWCILVPCPKLMVVPPCITYSAQAARGYVSEVIPTTFPSAVLTIWTSFKHSTRPSFRTTPHSQDNSRGRKHTNVDRH